MKNTYYFLLIAIIFSSISCDDLELEPTILVKIDSFEEKGDNQYSFEASLTFTGTDKTIKDYGFVWIINEWNSLPEIDFNDGDESFGTISTGTSFKIDDAYLIPSQDFVHNVRAYATFDGVEYVYSEPISLEVLNGSWKQIADLPGFARAYAIGFEQNGKGYVGTGWNGSTMLKDCWEYSPSNDSWTQKNDFPVQLAHSHTFVHNNKPYLIGGYDYIGSSTQTENDYLYEYNSQSDSWANLWTTSYVGRTGHLAFSNQNNAYVGLGKGNLVSTGSMGKYLGNNTWHDMAKMPIDEQIRYGVGFVIGDDAYVGTGYDGHSDITTLRSFWKYNATSGAWSRINGINDNRAEAVAFAINGKGYVVTGTTHFGSHRGRHVYEYEPTTDIWIHKTSFPYNRDGDRKGAVCFVIDNKAYVGTGITHGENMFYKDFWEFSPD